MASETGAAQQHIVSTKTNVLVFVALLALLAITVLAAQFDLGVYNIIIAVAVAVCKAVLIILYFMHIRYSGRLALVFAGAGFVWLAIMIALTLNDYLSRGWFAGPDPLGAPPPPH